MATQDFAETMSIQGTVVPYRCAERIVAIESGLENLHQFCGGLGEVVHKKADADSTATKDDVSAIKGALHQKADVSMVPTKFELSALQAVVQEKADISSVPTKAELAALHGLVHQKTNQDEVMALKEEVKKLHIALSSLAQDLQLKVEAAQVDAGHANESLSSTLHQLVNANASGLKEDLANLSTEVHQDMEKLRTSTGDHITALGTDLCKMVDASSAELRLEANSCEKAAQGKASVDAVATKQQIQEVYDIVLQKADVGFVPTKSEFAELAGAFSALQDMVVERGEEVAAALTRKVDVDSVPSKEDLAGLSGDLKQRADMLWAAMSRQWEASKTRADELTASMREQFQLVRDEVCRDLEALKQKGDLVSEEAKDKLEALRDEMRCDMEAHVCGEISSAIQHLEQKVEKDGGAVQGQLVELGEALKQKADVASVPTHAQLGSLREELQASSASVLMQLASLEDRLQQKADLESVMQNDLQGLREALEQKANMVEVLTKTQVQEALEQKADVASVPTHAQLEANSAGVRVRVASLEERMQQKVDVELAMQNDLQGLREALLLKANTVEVLTKTQVEEALGQKADVASVPTHAQLEASSAGVRVRVASLEERMQQKADVELAMQNDVQGLREALEQKANMVEVLTKTQVEEALKQKADVAGVPSSGQLEALRGDLCRGLEEKSSLLLADVAALSEKLEQKADAKVVTTRDDLDTLSDRVLKTVGDQMDTLRQTLQGKADTANAVTREQLEDGLATIRSAMSDTKVDLGPAHAEAKRQVAALEKSVEQRLVKEALEAGQRHAAVKDAIAKKADSVSTASRMDVEKMQALLEKKANVGVSPSAEEVRAMLSAVGAAMSKKAEVHAAAREKELKEVRAAMTRKAEIGSVATREQLELVKEALARKAESESVPSFEDVQALQANMNVKLGASKVALQQELDQIKESMVKKEVADAISMKMFHSGGVKEQIGSRPVPMKAAKDQMPVDSKALDLEAGSERALSPDASLLKRRRGAAAATPTPGSIRTARAPGMRR